MLLASSVNNNWIQEDFFFPLKPPETTLAFHASTYKLTLVKIKTEHHHKSGLHLRQRGCVLAWDASRPESGAEHFLSLR